MNITQSSWITVSRNTGDIAPVFRRAFDAEQAVEQATLEITALGVYEAELNGRRVGDFVLAPGWTSYQHRLQVQTYDVKDLLQAENDLRVTVGRGWFSSPIPGWMDSEDKQRRVHQPCGLIAHLTIRYADGSETVIQTDESWQWAEGPVRFSEIYDGETYDARIEPKDWQPVKLLDWPKDILIPQEGEIVRETERIAAKRVFRTPKGETVVDFGQEVTGYVEFTLYAKAGEEGKFTHGEVLDADGNFYNANYRSAKALVAYTCRDEAQTWHPRLTFFGFRYIKLISWPVTPHVNQFTAVVVHSDIKRTGWLKSGNAELNQLFSNIVWGQRGNFLDVPTDCPQRDERLGWTGDAQAFIKTASFFFDVEKFFKKWLHDMAVDQYASGEVGQVIPDVMPKDGSGSAAWGDAATICPWQIYQTYGDKAVLEDQFDCMKKWVDYITAATTTKDLWTGHFHFGDWLGLDAPSGSYKGSTREDFIATAFYAHSTELVIKAGKLLGKDVAAYEALRDRVVIAFRKAFPEYKTQTEHVLAVHFNLCEDRQQTADALAEMVRADGTQLRTGFVGTPYLLHVLSAYGHADLAWDLLLRREYPGWLYPVTKGATTVWEHWDGIREDGTFWSTDMNSYNHYAYGAVADWVFEQAAGLWHEEDQPGFAELIYEPHPDPRVGWLQAKIDTRHGAISALWVCEGDGVRYELSTPVPAIIHLDGQAKFVDPGRYTF
ncbi:MAG: family 78 glycoside hydrolase catalytic domain, partial [Clostridia bacterium]|nr:family 78 glycoside hydrolase catalytic domain [Clostridia bacterium]